MRRWLPALSYDRPVTVLMLFVALMVVGLIAWQRIPIQMMPDGFTPSFMWVSVPFPNASPRETDEKVVRPVQAQLGTISGLKSIRSRADDGRAGFGLEFHSSVDMDDVYAEVVDRMERAMPDLPEEIERYWVYKYNPDDEPIVWAGVTFPDSVVDPYHVMTKVVQPHLERIPGVASMDVWGVDTRAIYIDWDRSKLMAHGVDLGGVVRRLASDNFQQSAGQLVDRGKRQHVRSLARFDDLDTLRSYPVTEDLTLADVAAVELRSARSLDITRINGKSGAAMAIMKESAANTVEVSEALGQAMEELEADPRVQGAEFFTFFDQGELITESVDNLGQTALWGGIFALIILFLFLREWRMTALIALSIPLSLLITVGVLYFRGDSLNLLSLMGLMLAVGMVVDNAIVVIETIYRRRARGEGVREAAIEGTSEVNLAIILSTLTTMVVFLPIILMSENAAVSFFMGVLGLPVVFALAASLVVALVFAPLATRYMGTAQVKPDARWLSWSSRRYGQLLDWVLRHRTETSLALVLMGALTILGPVQNVGSTDSLEGNLGDFTVRYTVPPQASFGERDAIVHAFEEVVEEHRQDWGVRVYRTRLRDGDHSGRLYVYLTDDGPMSREEVLEAAEEALPDDLPGVSVRIGWSDSGSGGGGNSITLRVGGEDVGTLEDIAREAVRRVETVPGVLGAQVDFSVVGSEEVQLALRREALDRYNVSAMAVGQNVAWSLRGSELEPLLQGEREVDVISRFRLEDRDDLDTVLDLPMFTGSGMVPLRALADVEVAKAPSSIRREDGRTSVTVTVDLEEDIDLMTGWALVDGAVQGMELPRGYSFEKGERFRSQEEDTQSMYLAMALSICFVFLLMGILFESWLLPLSIITTIPMAMLGAWWGLFLSGTSLDTMGFVGLVILVGVVVNNGIVLVDLVTQLRAEGMARDEALVEAGRRRLRPILMTALTTIFGLLPMAMGTSSFIGIPYVPLGRVVIGGLATATVLTLLFVPFLYTLLDDLGVAARRWVGFALRRHA